MSKPKPPRTYLGRGLPFKFEHRGRLFLVAAAHGDNVRYGPMGCGSLAWVSKASFEACFSASLKPLKHAI
jgi:hypothetical protein